MGLHTTKSTKEAKAVGPIADEFLNGINITKLQQTKSAVKKNKNLGQFKFRVNDQWIEGSHTKATIKNFRGSGQELKHKAPFALETDQPSELLGADVAPTPFEYTLSALSACMVNAVATGAAEQGIKIESIKADSEGDVDLQGMLNLNPKVRKGIKQIQVNMQVKGDVSKKKLEELARLSPIYDTITNPVNVKINIEKV